MALHTFAFAKDGAAFPESVMHLLIHFAAEGQRPANKPAQGVAPRPFSLAERRSGCRLMASLREPCQTARDSATLKEWPSAMATHGARSDAIHPRNPLTKRQWGNALGIPEKNEQALKGRDTLLRPFRAGCFFCVPPRALPWAGLFAGLCPSTAQATPKVHDRL